MVCGDYLGARRGQHLNCFWAEMAVMPVRDQDDTRFWFVRVIVGYAGRIDVNDFSIKANS